VYQEPYQGHTCRAVPWISAKNTNEEKLNTNSIHILVQLPQGDNKKNKTKQIFLEMQLTLYAP